MVQLLLHHLGMLLLLLLHLHSHLLLHGILLLLRGDPRGMSLVYSLSKCRLVASLRGRGPASCRVVPCGQVHLSHRLALQCSHTITAGGHAHGIGGALRGSGHGRSLPHPHARLHVVAWGRRALLHVQVWFLREVGR